MKRDIPSIVSRELQSIFGGRLRLEWSDVHHWWRAHWDGDGEGFRRSMVLKHYDGKYMTSLDGYTDEIIQMIHKWRHNGYKFLMAG